MANLYKADSRSRLAEDNQPRTWLNRFSAGRIEIAVNPTCPVIKHGVVLRYNAAITHKEHFISNTRIASGQQPSRITGTKELIYANMLANFNGARARANECSHTVSDSNGGASVTNHVCPCPLPCTICHFHPKTGTESTSRQRAYSESQSITRNCGYNPGELYFIDETRRNQRYIFTGTRVTRDIDRDVAHGVGNRSLGAGACGNGEQESAGEEGEVVFHGSGLCEIRRGLR